MIRYLVIFVMLTATPMAKASSGWIFYGHRRPSLSSMAKGFMPESERVEAEDKSKGELLEQKFKLALIVKI